MGRGWWPTHTPQTEAAEPRFSAAVFGVSAALSASSASAKTVASS